MTKFWIFYFLYPDWDKVEIFSKSYESGTIKKIVKYFCINFFPIY